MLTKMTDADWTIVLRAFEASRSRRGDQQCVADAEKSFRGRSIIRRFARTMSAMARSRARNHHPLRLAAALDEGCVIGRTSRMYSASAAQKFWA
jgi:hypothetical protein